MTDNPVRSVRQPVDEDGIIRIVDLTGGNLNPTVNLLKTCFLLEFSNGNRPERSMYACLTPSVADQYADMRGIYDRRQWVAEINNKIVGTIGHIVLDQDRKEADWLNWFCVDPCYRRRGIGSRLLAFLEDQAIRRGKRYLRLWTSGHPQYAAALCAYGKAGYCDFAPNAGIADDEESVIYKEKRLGKDFV